MNDSLINKAYVAQSKNENILSQCTSGGFFTTIAYEFIKEGGYICGAVYGDNFEVKHIITNDLLEIERFAGSKYVQSKLNNVFFNIEKLLKEKKKVLFCGTPCQVCGLKKFLLYKKVNISNLYLIDLVCHGVPSPRLWSAYLNYTIQKRGFLKSVNFRSKYLGYHTSVMEEINIDGKRYVGSARTHIMSKIFFSNIADRPCCYDCKFKSVKRDSDLTIFDSWHAKNLVTNIKDNDKGYSNVLVQSDKGQQLVLKYKNLFYIYTCDYIKAIEMDGVMVTNSVKPNKYRNEFYNYLNKNGIESAVAKYLPISKKDYLIEKIKIIIKRNPILSGLVDLRLGK